MRTASKLPRIRDPETLRTYANILRKDVRIPVKQKDGSTIMVRAGATIIDWTAAEALDFAADEMEIEMQFADGQ